MVSLSGDKLTFDHLFIIRGSFENDTPQRSQSVSVALKVRGRYRRYVSEVSEHCNS